jgi:hypothetical protein
MNLPELLIFHPHAFPKGSVGVTNSVPTLSFPFLRFIQFHLVDGQVFFVHASYPSRSEESAQVVNDEQKLKTVRAIGVLTPQTLPSILLNPPSIMVEVSLDAGNFQENNFKSNFRPVVSFRLGGPRHYEIRRCLNNIYLKLVSGRS